MGIKDQQMDVNASEESARGIRWVQWTRMEQVGHLQEDDDINQWQWEWRCTVARDNKGVDEGISESIQERNNHITWHHFATIFGSEWWRKRCFQ